jgi:hypothetical protein
MKSDLIVIPLVNTHQRAAVHSVQKCRQGSGSTFKCTNIAFIHTVHTFGDTGADMITGNIIQKSTVLCSSSYSLMLSWTCLTKQILCVPHKQSSVGFRKWCGTTITTHEWKGLPTVFPVREVWESPWSLQVLSIAGYLEEFHILLHILCQQEFLNVANVPLVCYN